MPDWKIPDNYLKIKCGISLLVSQNNQQNQNDEFDSVNLDVTSESDLDSELDDTSTGIRQAVQQKYLIPIVGKVIVYRKNSAFGYQCFVQYGSDKAPTYRLVPASQACNWDPNRIIS